MSAPSTSERLLAEVGPPPRRWREPVLVVLMGLPGTGKTGTAAYLGNRLPLVVLSTDAIRLRHGLASGPATHEVMRIAAARLLADGAGVLLDGIHLGRDHRDGWRALAASCGARFELVYATARPTVVAARLRARRAAPDETATRGTFVVAPEHVRRLADHLEEPTPDEGAWLLDTSAGPTVTLHDMVELATMYETPVPVGTQLAETHQVAAVWSGSPHPVADTLLEARARSMIVAFCTVM